MVRGFVESIRPFQVRGWAFDERWPENPACIRVQLGDEVLTTGTADLYRQDLREVADRTGRHCFVINFDVPISRADADHLSVIVVSLDGAEASLPQLQNVIASFDGVSPPKGREGHTVTPTLLPLSCRELAHHPVFILGSARSGTSAIAQGLVKTSRYAGDEEGHFFEVIAVILETISAFYASRGEEWATDRATTIARVPQSYLEAGFKRLMIETARELFPTGYWLDKTPRLEMIKSATLMLGIWPDTKFVFAKRRGLENLFSRVKKFPSISFEDHCIAWAASMNCWLEIREQLDSSAIEIDQIDLAREPAQTANLLGSFLNLQPSEIANLCIAFQYDQPERTSARIARPFRLQDLEWSQAQIGIFRSVCGETMERYSYTMDERYRL